MSLRIALRAASVMRLEARAYCCVSLASRRCLLLDSFMISVCFVCLGNICRSPTAEGVFLNLLNQQGLRGRFIVASAGTAAYHVGKRADARSRQHAKKRGYELPSIARQFEAADFTQFDYVLAMDQQNFLDLQQLQSQLLTESKAQLRLFREFAFGEELGTLEPALSVPDPYYGGDAGFEEVLDICEVACAGFLKSALNAKKP